MSFQVFHTNHLSQYPLGAKLHPPRGVLLLGGESFEMYFNFHMTQMSSPNRRISHAAPNRSVQSVERECRRGYEKARGGRTGGQAMDESPFSALPSSPRSAVSFPACFFHRPSLMPRF